MRQPDPLTLDKKHIPSTFMGEILHKVGASIDFTEIERKNGDSRFYSFSIIGLQFCKKGV